MAAVSGAKIEVSNRRTSGKRITEWTVDYEEGGEQMHTVYRVMNYDDIIRKNWVKSKLKIVFELFKLLLFMWRAKFFRNRWRVKKTCVMVCGFFFLLCFAFLILAFVSGLLVWFLLPYAQWIKILCVGTVEAMVLWWAYRWGEKYDLYWFFRSLIYLNKQYQDTEFSERRTFFSKKMLEADVEQKFDEILVVGYSSGSVFASECVAHAFELDSEFGGRSAEVSMLTVGGCIAGVTGLGVDAGYLPYLRKLAECQNLEWVDITERHDLISQYVVNPFALLPEYQNLPEQNIPSPRLIRARFFRLFDEIEFDKLKEDTGFLHEQYLKASERDGEYNYFRITCGPKFLRNQFLED
jgi:hypothetical protein